MPAKISIQKTDITKLKVDAIVNAANTSLLGGGGVDGAIHRAGGPAILEACMQIRSRQGGCNVGEAVITTAGRLPSKFVIHAVGPVWNNGSKNERQLLANAYQHSFALAAENGITSIAFPNISTGIYHFPKQLAAEIAIDETTKFISTDTMLREIIFVCFDEENFEIYQKLLNL
ncbi:MAG: O-acetyl-ADP-ribose deacetylase [Chitinophagaceae bacterium]